jgi:hypothetical protein
MPQIVIVIAGGSVQEVMSDIPDLKLEIIDFDLAEEDEGHAEVIEGRFKLARENSQLSQKLPRICRAIQG